MTTVNLIFKFMILIVCVVGILNIGNVTSNLYGKYAGSIIEAIILCCALYVTYSWGRKDQINKNKE